VSKTQINKTPGREFALKFLFQLFLKENLELKNQYLAGSIESSDLDSTLAEFKESYVAPDEEHPDNSIDDASYFFACKLVKGVSQNMATHEELLKKQTKRDSLEAIDKIERSVLLIGTQELLHHDTPYQVVINELVNLAKKYGGADSGRFINGVLDSVRIETK
jgi:N utilization substance protein B